MVLVGALLGALLALVYQWRPAAEAGPTLRRFAFRALLAFAVPAFFAMRIGAQWIYSKEFPEGSGSDPTWVGIGFMVSDVGGLLLIAACIVARRATTRCSRRRGPRSRRHGLASGAAGGRASRRAADRARRRAAPARRRGSRASRRSSRPRPIPRPRRGARPARAARPPESRSN